MSQDKSAALLSEDSSFDYTEAYVRLRTNFIYITMNGTYKKIVFTSCEQSEGKSTTVMNLAVSLAKSGKRVLLLDCDIRRSSLREYLGRRERRSGLSDILCNLKTVEECIDHVEEYGFDIIYAGNRVPNPSELLGSENMGKLLQKLEPDYDYILMDAPPVLSVSDPAILSTMADGVIFVVRQGKIRKQQYAVALHALETVEAKLLGTVMSMYENKHDHYRYGYGKKYYYYYYKRY